MMSDISYYYNWRVSSNVLETWIAGYNKYYTNLWDYIQNNKSITKNGDTDQYKTPLFTAENGVYYNVVKVDFRRAFTNYVLTVIDQPYRDITQNYLQQISKLPIPSDAKKFLYNYTITNILVNLIGNTALAKLRRTVYDDVLYIASQCGLLIKTEVDGAYIQTPLTELPVYDVYGQLTISPYKWVVWNNPIMVGQRINGIPSIKGLGKYTPNILAKTLETITTPSYTERDKVIENFLYSPNIHILDWCYKTECGDKIELILKNSSISMPSSNNDDITNLNELQSTLDRDKYLDVIENTIQILFETV